MLIPAHNNYDRLVTVDNVCDFIPVVSTINNITDIGIKIFSNLNVPKNDPKERYYKHLKDKSYLECVLLIIPGINIFVAVIKNIYIYFTKREERGAQGPQIDDKKDAQGKEETESPRIRHDTLIPKTNKDKDLFELKEKLKKQYDEHSALEYAQANVDEMMTIFPESVYKHLKDILPLAVERNDPKEDVIKAFEPCNLSRKGYALLNEIINNGYSNPNFVNQLFVSYDTSFKAAKNGNVRLNITSEESVTFIFNQIPNFVSLSDRIALSNRIAWESDKDLVRDLLIKHLDQYNTNNKNQLEKQTDIDQIYYNFISELKTLTAESFKMLKKIKAAGEMERKHLKTAKEKAEFSAAKRKAAKAGDVEDTLISKLKYPSHALSYGINFFREWANNPYRKKAAIQPDQKKEAAAMPTPPKTAVPPSSSSPQKVAAAEQGKEAGSKAKASADKTF